MNGIEWLVEAFGCSKKLLQSRTELADLFESIVSDMQLRPVGKSVWHQFPGAEGITGVWLLQESHLAIHTFPEFNSACLNLFCCSQRISLDWNSRLRQLLGATKVRVQECSRNYASAVPGSRWAGNRQDTRRTPRTRAVGITSPKLRP